MRVCVILLAALCGSIFSSPAMAAGKAKHVVVVVWDGMRPDFVSEKNTPTLFQLIQQGVWFENHHAVYLSATEVNGAAIATGAYPSHDGLIANREYRPELDPNKLIHTEMIETVRKGDKLSGGHYLRTPTIAEILHEKGMKTVVAGAKAIALLHDRAERKAGSAGITLFAGEALPANVLEKITGLYGAFPKADSTNLTRNDWTTEALIDPLWNEGVPEFTLLWLNEPDSTQHQTGPGSADSLTAMKNADDNLARVLQALDAKGLRDKTDIMVVSDHGFSTVLSMVDVAESLQKAGFNAQREFTAPPSKGDILVIGNGGSVLFYVTGHDENTIKRLVTHLQGWSHAGVVFTRQAMEGTFTLAQGMVDSPAAPDVLISMRWIADKNDAGVPGLLISDLYSYGPGQGMHGSLSRFDMHNTLVASGPDFRAGVVDHLPSGNVDVAPTALWILGVKQPKSMDGRALTEAMINADAKLKSYEPTHLETVRTNEKSIWHQYLNYTEVNGVVYLDEGNGYQSAK
jgi:arylsulfatase A-like enzyme